MRLRTLPCPFTLTIQPFWPICIAGILIAAILSYSLYSSQICTKIALLFRLSTKKRTLFM